MKSNRSKDAKILKKARFRVRGSFFLVFCALTAYYAGLSWLMTSPWISMPESMKTVFIASVGLEVMIAMVLLMWLYSEQPASRWGWFLFVLGEGAFTGWLAWQTISNPEGKLCWMAWGLCSMLKVWAMFSYGHWLKSSWWGQIFFDKTLKIYRGDEDYEEEYGYEQPQQKQMQQVRSPAGYTQAPYGGPYGQQQNQPYASNPYSGQGQPAQAGYPNAGGQPYEQTPVQQPAYSQPQHRAGQQEMSYQDVMNAYGQPVSPAPVQPAPASAYAEPVYEDEYEDESVGQEHEKKKTVYSYYQISLHIAFCVYSQLILMPIMCEFLHPAFVSTDRQYSFATQVMFSLCVISAIAWTVAVFFLYLNQPSSRKIVGVCMGVEVMTAIWTGIKLMSIAKTVDIAYPWYAYALFIFLDVVRVGLILWAAWPVFTVPVPEPDESRSFMAPRFDDCEDFDDPSAGS